MIAINQHFHERKALNPFVATENQPLFVSIKAIERSGSGFLHTKTPFMRLLGQK